MNQATQHTPGPWRLDKYQNIVHGQRDETLLVCGVAIPCGRVMPDDVGYANGRLVAAAPELLSALRGCLQCFDEMTGRKPAFVVDSIAISKEAIAKATGAA